MPATSSTSSSDPSKASATPAADAPPYQTSGFEDVGEDNPGPFDEGEGKNSHLLKANQPEAK